VLFVIQFKAGRVTMFAA